MKCLVRDFFHRPDTSDELQEDCAEGIQPAGAFHGIKEPGQLQEQVGQCADSLEGVSVVSSEDIAELVLFNLLEIPVPMTGLLIGCPPILRQTVQAARPPSRQRGWRV